MYRIRVRRGDDALQHLVTYRSDIQYGSSSNGVMHRAVCTGSGILI
jgi:hypothetical protein